MYTKINLSYIEKIKYSGLNLYVCSIYDKIYAFLKK